MGRLTAGILRGVYSKPEYRGKRARLAHELLRINREVEERKEVDRLVRAYREGGNHTLAYVIEKRGVA